MKAQLVIIGAGPAGLAAAVKAYDAGVKDILVLERESEPGGVLKQCIHNGFGLTRFGENLTGPEYADRFERAAYERGIEVRTGTTVTHVSPKKVVTCMDSSGVFDVEADAVVLAMGCRERSRGALSVPGTRPAGVYSAGTAQRYVNIKGWLPGRRVVIVGSGDIGLIMARRMTLEGAKVLCVCEIMPHSSGLKRNIVQCLDDFGIPLYLEHTVTEIEGTERVSGVTVAKVDAAKKPIPGTEMHFDCDTVLYSVGLIPENELTERVGIALSPATKGAVVDSRRQTEIEGVFACGNVLHVHDLVDFVSEEAELAGAAAADFVLGRATAGRTVDGVAGSNVSYVLPQKIDVTLKQKLFFRVRSERKNVTVVVRAGDKEKRFKRLGVAPGEMESVTVDPGFLEGADKVTVEVVE